MESLALLPLRASLLPHHESPKTKRKTSKQFTFLVETKKPEANVSGKIKAIINSHIAKQTHDKRKVQQAESREVAVPRTSESYLSFSWESGRTTPWYGSFGEPPDGTDNFFIPSPSSILRRGNSDPFITTRIPVTTAVHECMVFTRDCFLPSLHGKEIDLAKTSVYMDAFWQDTVEGLQDECIGYAYLSRSAAIITTITVSQETENLSLYFKSRAIAALRKRMKELNTAQTKLALCWAIYSLFSAEIAGHNFPAAEIHGKFLRQLIQPEERDRIPVMTDSRFRQAAMYQDIQRASVSLTRPSFDLDRWLAEFLPGTWLEEIGLDITLPPVVLDLAIEDIYLREVFDQTKQWLMVLGIVLSNPSLLNPFVISNGSTRLLILEGQLINIYLDTMEELESVAGAGKLHLYHLACCCLAALTWLRRMGNHENFGIGSRLSLTGTNVYNAGPIVVTTMSRLLMKSEAEAKESTDPFAMRIRLWALYVGAIVEQSLPAIDPLAGYHNVQFCALARRMNLESWDSVQEVLDGFLYFEGVGPTARAWFEIMSQAKSPSESSVGSPGSLVDLRRGYVKSLQRYSDAA
ncbi:uncharacterized protein A1O9_02913 [Exophiala aquamarina CBS 119918]|uniref:Transcription factor domain-containing protein n=1 Tax=Exophiala aquamarina CBS 119918 TaxID=1182545 RepID=A0A072PNP2_9EURO|nr:uncharacterized protein A1O9_02913 [Exophiala aquamarina CBS 119918]KEF61347.1 hypothetical protein A1O9_02913 [Exophiala aquamarina CBS 119918]